MRAEYGPGGWIRVSHDDLPGALLLRMEPDENGRWRTRDLVLRGEWRAIVGADLREMPLSAVEEWLQSDMDIVEGFSRLPNPGLAPLIEAMGPMPKWRSTKSGPRADRLQRPTHGLTDDFLRGVGAAYAQAMLDGKAPAPELARQVGDGATPRTIHKWVATARQRGLMAPAPRSRAK